MGHRRVAPVIAASVAAAVALMTLAGCSLLGQSPPAATAPSSPPAAAAPAAAPASNGGSVAVTAAPETAAARISRDVDGIKAREIVADGGRLVDVRPRARWVEAHIKGAESVPMSRFATVAAKWDRKKPVVVYDNSGTQSQSAQVWLERHGFAAVYHLYRGIDGWDEGLVGNDPKPLPAREPVLYYLYGSSDFIPALPTLPSDRERIMLESDKFVRQLKKDLDYEFEYHAYDVGTADGLAQLQDFAGTAVPMYVIVDERGRDEQFVGLDAQVQVHAHLQRAIKRFHQSQE